MAELVRRGLEYMVAVSPMPEKPVRKPWSLPEPVDLGSRDPFLSENWRADLYMHPDKVAENPREYGEDI
ncbi:MAG: hypothetical protein ACO3N7_03535 [Kiritimatiellia bacterium]